MNETFLTPAELFEQFGIPIQTQAKWRMKNNNKIKIPFIKLGRRIVYKRSSIVEFLDSLERNKIGRYRVFVFGFKFNTAYTLRTMCTLRGLI